MCASRLGCNDKSTVLFHVSPRVSASRCPSLGRGVQRLGTAASAGLERPLVGNRWQKHQVYEHWRQQQSSRFCQLSVGLWTTRRRVVQLQLLHNKQTSEIEVAKQLLRRLPPQLAQTVTLDALHAQTETLKTLSELQLHYVIGLKANQPSLYQAAQDLRVQAQPNSRTTEFDQGHGRSVQRTVSVYTETAEFAHKWQRLTSLIWVERCGTRGTQAYDEKQGYLSSAAVEAHTFARLIRGHWQIENRLHWVKDVTFKEDNPPRRGAHAPVTWAIFHSFCITLARRLGFRTVPDCQRDLANQVQQVFHLLV